MLIPTMWLIVRLYYSSEILTTLSNLKSSKEKESQKDHEITKEKKN